MWTAYDTPPIRQGTRSWGTPTPGTLNPGHPGRCRKSTHHSSRYLYLVYVYYAFRDLQVCLEFNKSESWPHFSVGRLRANVLHYRADIV